MQTEYNVLLFKYNTNLASIPSRTTQKFDPLGRTWNISYEPNGQINLNVIVTMLIIIGICIFILFSVNPK